MACGRQLIYQITEDRARALLVRCKCWGCSTCGPIRTKRLRAWALDGKPDMFITLTCNPGTGRDKADRAARMVKGWRKLVQAIKRKNKSHEFEYIAVFEAHPGSGEPHMHILCRSRFIPQGWLSQQWKRLTGAFIVDVRRLDHAGRGAYYVTKYLSKAPFAFAKRRRYLMSRKYRAPKRKPPDPIWKTLQYVETILPLARLITDFKAAGWELVRSSIDAAEWIRPPGAGPPPYPGALG